MGNRSKQPPGSRPQRAEPLPHGRAPDLGVPSFSPWTVEGRIEQVGAMARGIRGLSRGKRAAALVLFLIVFVGPLLIGVFSMMAGD